MGQQRQAARFSFAVAHQQLDQAVLQPQAGQLRRLLDGPAQRITGQRRHEMQAALDELAQLGIDAELAETVTADGDDHVATAVGVGNQRPTQVIDRVRRMAELEQLLELVDDDHGCGCGCPDLGRCRTGIVSRHDDQDLAAATTQRRDEPGAHERRLAASRRSGDDQERVGAESLHAGRRLVVPTEERVGVVFVERGQSLVRAVAG